VIARLNYIGISGFYESYHKAFIFATSRVILAYIQVVVYLSTSLNSCKSQFFPHRPSGEGSHIMGPLLPVQQLKIFFVKALQMFVLKCGRVTSGWKIVGIPVSCPLSLICG